MGLSPILTRSPDFLVPMMPRREILTGRSVAIRAGQIAAILPTRAQASARAHRTAGLCLMPGLINLHCHAAMSLLGLCRRSVTDDLVATLHLADRSFGSPEFVRDGSEWRLPIY